jgi:hypothetical protein
MPNENNCNRQAPVVINVRRIYDSARKLFRLDHAEITIETPPPTAVPPFTFISAVSTECEAVVSNLIVNRLPAGECQAHPIRVRCTITIPLEVFFRDANGVEFTSDSQISVPEDIVLHAPPPGGCPFEVIATAACNCPSGDFETNTAIDCTACINVITKIAADTDIAIQPLAYPLSPLAHDYSEIICQEFFRTHR